MVTGSTSYNTKIDVGKYNKYYHYYYCYYYYFYDDYYYYKANCATYQKLTYNNNNCQGPATITILPLNRLLLLL